MLCQFGFKNFKSYKNETIFDFQAGKLNEFKDSLIKVDDKATQLLPVSVVYGPNGGGKTTLLQALACLITMVVSPIRKLKKNREHLILQQDVDCEPFIFDEKSKNEPTEFNLFFRKNSNEYRYYVAIKNDIIISESLFRRGIGAKKTAVIFEREEDNIELGASIGKNGINTEVNPKMLFLSFLAINYNIPVIAEVQECFESCVIRNYANPNIDSSIIVLKDESFKKSFINLLNKMGVDICDYNYDDENKEFLLSHKVNGIGYSLTLDKESAGTIKLFGALPILMIALQTGRLAIIDELDAKLHPKLLRYIISLFTDPNINKHGAQLLFTSHDMSTMSNEVFRKDEIWFAALDDEHSSELYSLYEIRKEDGKRVNATASYNKQYLEGRYGADPYFKKMLEWEDFA